MSFLEGNSMHVILLTNLELVSVWLPGYPFEGPQMRPVNNVGKPVYFIYWRS